VLLVAPLLGRWPGHIPDVFETLGPLLEANGHEVVSVSSHRGRLRRAGQMVATASRTRPDATLIHLYSGRSALLEDLVSMLQRKRSGRLIGVLAGGGFPEFEGRHPRFTRRLLRRFDRLVGPSPYLADWASSIVGVPVSIIPNPLDTSGYPFRSRSSARPLLLWMRAYHPVYDPLTALDVIDRLRQVHADAHLTMAGPDKGMQAAVDVEVRGRGLEDHVTVLGFVTGCEKMRLFATNDIYLNTPVVDNRPVTIVEAAASGMCIVSTDAGGIPQLVTDGRDALLAPVGDARALAAAVLQVCADPSKANSLSENAARIAAAGAPAAVRAAWSELLG